FPPGKLAQPEAELILFRGVAPGHLAHQQASVRCRVILTGKKTGDGNPAQSLTQLIWTSIGGVEEAKAVKVSNSRPGIDEGSLGIEVDLVFSQQELAQKQCIGRGDAARLLRNKSGNRKLHRSAANRSSITRVLIRIS